MFTNKYRTQRIIALSLIISLFCIHSHRNRPEIALTFRECLLSPEKYDNRELIVKNEAKTGEIFKDKFEILQGDDKITVVGPTEELKRNEFVTMRATFHKEGFLTVKEMHVHRFRRLKMVISILPVILVGWIFFRRYRFNLRKIMFTPHLSARY